jgi:hypothetical protein
LSHRRREEEEEAVFRRRKLSGGFGIEFVCNVITTFLCRTSSMVPEEDCITTRAMQKLLAKEEEKETTSRISCRSPQVELIRRELMAVKKKVRSLQDPSATTVFSFDTQQQLFSTLDHHTCGSVTRLSWSRENTAAAAFPAPCSEEKDEKKQQEYY